MGVKLKLKGQKFGRLKAIKEVGKDRDSQVIWLCKCECGNFINLTAHTLKRGHTKSCGCLQKDIAREHIRKIGKSLKGKKLNEEQARKARIAGVIHNMSRTRFYRIWGCMRQRCNNKNSSKYSYYGGRGIVVCDRWQKFENFRDDMHQNYIYHCTDYGEKNTTLDRIDNEGNYEPSNCRWATRKEQSNNTRITNNLIKKSKTIT